MMNGKKSYLISFTALFSKRGYELKIGFEQIINANNQYHLTAPVNSTYKTLIEVTMKNANKAPHSATGLFGRLGSAEYVTQYDGFEVETVVASIVSFLSGIHKYFNGETVTDVTAEERHSARRLEPVLDAEGAEISVGMPIEKEATLEQISSGELYDVKVSVAEGNRVSISLSNKQSVIYALETTSFGGVTADAQTDQTEMAENGIRLNAEEGRAVLSIIVRSILDGDMALLSSATHDPLIKEQGVIMQAEYGDNEFYRAHGEDFPFTLVDTVTEGQELKHELAETSYTDLMLEGYVLSDTRQDSLLEKGNDAWLVEVISDVVSSRTETANVTTLFTAQNEDLVSVEKQNEAELTLTTLADTYGGGDAEIDMHVEADTLHNAHTTLDEFIEVDTRMDADLKLFTEVYTYQNAVMQGFTLTDVVLQASTQSEEYGEMEQPVYNGQVGDGFVYAVTRQDGVSQESLAYESLIFTPVYMDEQTYTDTFQNSYSTEEVVTSKQVVKDTRIESTQSVDTSVAASVQEYLLYETVQEGVTDAFLQVDSRTDGVATPEYVETAVTWQYGSLLPDVESAKVEMDYDAVTVGMEEAGSTDKYATVGGLQSGDMTKDVAVGEYGSAGLFVKDAEVEYLTGSYKRQVEAIGQLELVHQGKVMQGYNTEIERLVDTEYVSGEGDIQLFTDAEVYIDGYPLIGRLLDTTNVTDSRDAEIEEFAAADATERMDAEVENLVTVSQIQNVIAESPEILKAVRLMEIMYGSKATELIEAGMDDIIRDSVNQGATQADFTVITQAVIEKMKQAGAGTTVIASNQDAVLAEQQKSTDAEVERLFSGRVLGEPEGTLPQGLSGASMFDFNQTADVVEITRAIAEANKSLGVFQSIDMAEHNTFGEGLAPSKLAAAETDSTVDGLNQELESAVSEPTAEGVGAGSEPGSVSMRYEGDVSESVTAEPYSSMDGVGLSFDTAEQSDSKTTAFMHNPETASKEVSTDSVVHNLSSAEHRTDKDAVIQEIEDAQVGEGNTLSYLHEFEEASQSDQARESVAQLLEMGEYSDAGQLVTESLLEGAAYSASTDAVVAEIEAATSHTSHKAINHSMTSADYSDGSTTSVIHEVESACIDDSNKVGTIGEMTQASTTSGAEAVVHEGTQAEYSLSEGLAVVEDLDAALRKRIQLETDIQNDLEADNNRESIETSISEPEEAARPTKVFEVDVEQAGEASRTVRSIEVNIEHVEGGKRPTREIETKLERSEGGVIKTPEEPKKPRIWLIIGKIASWSIWNWKKTR